MEYCWSIGNPLVGLQHQRGHVRARNRFPLNSDQGLVWCHLCRCFLLWHAGCFRLSEYKRQLDFSTASIPLTHPCLRQYTASAVYADNRALEFYAGMYYTGHWHPALHRCAAIVETTVLNECCFAGFYPDFHVRFFSAGIYGLHTAVH